MLDTTPPKVPEQDDDNVFETIKESEVTHEVDLQKYWRATAALCMSNLTQSYLLISVFPYSGFMAMDLVSSVTEENAGRYAGLIASVFMAGRALSSYPWGKFADTYGRKPVLLVSLFWSALASIAFGLSKSFSMALVTRFLLGLNGVMATAKTAVSELAKGDRQLETKGMGIVMGMWGWGFLVSPAVAGWLAEPLKQYPHFFENWGADTWIHHFMDRFPFFLPNLVAFLLCAVSFLLVSFNIEETLLSPRETKHIPSDFGRHLHILGRDIIQHFRRCSLHHTKSASRDHHETLPILKQNSRVVPYSKVNVNDVTDNKGDNNAAASNSTALSITMSTIWGRPSTRRHLIVYWLGSFMMVCIDESFPLFCISKEGGLGLSERSIGKILSGAGLLFALAQYAVYGTMMLCCGLNNSIQICLFLTVPLIAMIPLSVPLNSSSDASGGGGNSVSWNTFVYLCVVNSLLRMFFLTFFSGITVATNHTVPSHYLGTMNGLSMLGGSVAKGVGPTFAGFLVTFCLSSGLVVPATMGPFAVFGILSAVMLTIAIFSHHVLSSSTTATEEGAASSTLEIDKADVDGSKQ